jgi:VanZ family protein
MNDTMKIWKHAAYYQVPLFLWLGFIFFLSSLSSSRLPSINLPVGADKVIHACLYFVLCSLTHRAFKHQSNVLFSKMSLFVAIVVTIAYGCTDEYHQLFVAGRSADFHDLMADAVGGLLYVAFVLIWTGKKTDS